MTEHLFVTRTNVVNITIHGEAVLVKSQNPTTKLKIWDIYSLDEAIKQGYVKQD